MLWFQSIEGQELAVQFCPALWSINERYTNAFLIVNANQLWRWWFTFHFIFVFRVFCHWILKYWPMLLWSLQLPLSCLGNTGRGIQTNHAVWVLRGDCRCFILWLKLLWSSVTLLSCKWCPQLWLHDTPPHVCQSAIKGRPAAKNKPLYGLCVFRFLTGDCYILCCKGR